MLKYGIIGCGMMGREHIRNISLLSDTKISGIFEPNLEMRKLASQLVPDAIFCETLEDLILNIPIDCLIIATPNFCHMQDLCKIANIKHIPILIEKVYKIFSCFWKWFLVFPQSFLRKLQLFNECKNDIENCRYQYLYCSSLVLAYNLHS